MTQCKSTTRPAMTAIAAVLAFSATPLFAQAGPAAVDPPSPLSISSSVEPTAPPAAVADPAPSAAALTPDPVEATMTEAPADTPARTAHVAKAAPVAKALAAKSVVPSLVAKAVPPVRAPVIAESPKVAAAPVAHPRVIPPKTAAPATVAQSRPAKDALPIAAGAGAAVLALVGAGVALRRRRDEDEVVEEAVHPEPANAEPTVFEPAPSAPAPAFDRSTLSPRVAAAYEGPTEENPSLSVKKRVKRAHALDLMDRRNGVSTEPQAERPGWTAGDWADKSAIPLTRDGRIVARPPSQMSFA